MAGHSKWANIRFRKGVQDQKRGKIFTKLIREITIAARQGGGDLNSNSRLRLAVDKAYANNMSKDTVERAIKRGAGGLDDSNVEELRYEGYGPGGVAIIVDCMSDNRNRTVAEVRHAFSKCGGNLGTDGSVAYLFTKQGNLTFASGSPEEKIMELAIELGADDVIVNADKSIDVITSAENFQTVKDGISKANLVIEEAELTMRAATNISLNKEEAEKMLKLQDMLEDLDDVQVVYSNADIPEEILRELSEQ